MRVRDVILALQSLPPDAELDLGRVMAVARPTNPDPDRVDTFEVLLDQPVVGIATNGTNALLVIEYGEMTAVLGTVTHLGEFAKTPQAEVKP